MLKEAIKNAVWSVDGGVASAIEQRIEVARRAVDAAVAPDDFTGGTMADRARWAADLAERRAVKVRAGAGALAALVRDAADADSVEQLQNGLSDAVAAVAREAATASESAATLKRHADAAERSINMGRILIGFADQPGSGVDAEWLESASDRLGMLAETLGAVRAHADDADLSAVDAAASLTDAKVWLEQTRTGVQLASIRRAVARLGEDCGLVAA
ncbi:MAG: hypothetical protein LBD97_05335 [Bifidobacteriaceae bacterium]|nr:hypothetical protein [Bifidobacteriaceae bacterium]